MRLALVALIAGCGGGHSQPPPDPNPIDVTPAMYLTDMTLAEIHDGDQISLEFPPQGGHVLFVGARVRHLDDPTVILRGRLRSAADDSIFAEEARTVTMQPDATDPSVMQPDLRSYSNVANVPVCPSYTTSNIYGQTYVLEVVVTEQKSGRVGTARRMVVPSCLQSDATSRAFCECDCGANYVLGKCG